MLKKLARSKVRCVSHVQLALAEAEDQSRSLGELLLLSDDQRDAALSAVSELQSCTYVHSLGAVLPQLELEESRRTDIQQLLGAVPSISLAATCETEVRRLALRSNG